MGATAPADEFGLVGAIIEDRYHVETVVAVGGFGVVYRGFHVTLGNAVAVKVLKPQAHLSPEARGTFIDMFVAEARIVAQLGHPAVVRAFDFGALVTPSGITAPWMALEWIDGATLASHLEARRGRGGRPPHEVLNLMLPVLDALAEAHRQGIAHRDIKPGNIMLPDDAGGDSGPGASRRRMAGTRLLDFGIAKVIEGDTPESGATRTESSVGAFSPRYAAPEQASRTRSGPWTDVHALALILTELLVDDAPYHASDKITLLGEIMSTERPTPRKHGVDVGLWEPVLARALARHPKDRYPDAGAFLSALEASLPGAKHARLDAPTPSAPPVRVSSAAPQSARIRRRDRRFAGEFSTINEPGPSRDTDRTGDRRASSGARSLPSSRSLAWIVAACASLFLAAGIVWWARRGLHAPGGVPSAEALARSAPAVPHDTVTTTSTLRREGDAPDVMSDVSSDVPTASDDR